MVGLVLVAHSPELVAGLAAMVRQAAPGVAVSTAAGTERGSLGTSAPAVSVALREALEHSSEGCVLLLDLGSAGLSVEIALEELPPADRARVRVTGAPLVEGAVLAAVEADSGADLDAVVAAAERAASMPKLPWD